MLKYIKTIIIYTIAWVATPLAYAQVAENALKFAQTNTLGTARVQGFGGAGFALGGDVSAAALNPAGLGFFNRSAFVITPSFNYTGTTAGFLDQRSELTDTDFGIGNFGIVFNNTKEDVIPSDWRGGSFSITYNRVFNHSFDYTFEPAINSFSILDDFALQANGIPFQMLEDNIDNNNITSYATAAYFNYLINPDASGENYLVSIPDSTLADQNGFVEESSRQTQWNIAYGGNFKDKLYIGASIGFRGFRYERSGQFEENYQYPNSYLDFIDQGGYFFPVSDGEISIDFVNYNRLEETQTIEGTGINASLGVIYRPVNEVTIGLTYQTPTVYSVTEDYQFNLASNVAGIGLNDSTFFDLAENGEGFVEGDPILTQYTLTTPARIGVGLAYFFQKYGFITADIEYLNFDKNKFSSNEFSTAFLNEEINRFFKPVVNYKVGGEFRYDIFRFRLGYAHYASPTQFPGDELNRDRRLISGGVGVHLPKFYADLAVTNTQYEGDYRPYAYASNFPLADTYQRNLATQASLTLGFNF